MYRQNLKKYLDDLASKKPAPGGGSAAALSGAIGAALASKVANFTVGKEKYKQVEQEMSNIFSRSEQLRESFNRLCSQDVKAYKKLAQALKLPKEIASATQERQKKVQEALKQAVAVPLQICKDAHQAIKLCLPLAQKGNINLITDVSIASIMLHSAFQSALLNIEINLKSIKDEKFILGIREALKPMEREVGAISQEVNKEIEKYLAKK